MTRWLRWQGLLGFVVVVGLLGGFWLLLIDSLVKWSIEGAGTKVVGARVELQKADLSLAPLGLTLTGLRVTNPEAPMTNAVEAGRIAFNADPWHLLRRKVIVEEMAVQRLRFNTPRATSGALAKKEASREEKKGQMLPTLDLPTAEEILSRETLTSVQQIRDVDSRIETLRTEWRQKLDELPGPETITEYRERIDRIKSGGRGVQGMMSQASEIAQLKKDIDADRDRIKDALNNYGDQVKALRTQIDQARKAPVEEVRRLLDKYALSPAGGVNMTRLLFGDKVAGWVATALKWRARLQPFYERARDKAQGPEQVKPMRAKGIDVHFTEHRPMPDLLIRRIALSAETVQGDFTGTVRNVTAQQPLVGEPLSFALEGTNLPEVQAASVQGRFDRVQPDKPLDVLRAAVKKYRSQNIPLSQSDPFPLTVESGLLDLDLTARLAAGQLEASLDSRLTEATLVMEPQKQTPLNQALASALAGVNTLSLKAEVKGSPDDYHLSLSSDLEKVLQQAVGTLLREKAQALEQNLREQVTAQVKAPLEALEEQFKGMQDVRNNLEGRLGGLEELLGSLGGGSEGLNLPF